MFRKLILFFLLIQFSLSHFAFAQCWSGGTDMGSIVPTTLWQTIPCDAGQYWTFTADVCDKYTFSFCQGGGSSTFDTEITITDNSGNPVVGAYNNDACGPQSEVTFTPYTPGDYRVLVTIFSCVYSGGTGSVLAFKSGLIYTANPNYVLVNAATSAAPYSCVTLTPDLQGQTGCAWDLNSTLNFGADFTYDFIVNLGSNDNTGADGMCFVMQNDPRGRCAFVLTGGAIGASGIANSLIVEIDTYLSNEDRDDGMAGVTCTGGTDPDHLDIWLNGVINPGGASCPGSPGARIIPAAIRLKNGLTLHNIENGQNHLLRVAWNFATSTFSASVYNGSGATLYGTVTYSFNPATVFGTSTPFFGFTASTGFYTNNQSFCSPPILLPVQLLSFEGKTAGQKNNLHWTTASESNNDFFLIQRSKNAMDFETIGKVEGAGNSNQLSDYFFTDEKPFPNETYYRLMQNDFDGNSSYSEVIDLKNNNNVYGDFKVYPNPATKSIFLLTKDDFENAEVEIENVFGVLKIKQLYKNIIDISDLSNGVYFIKVKNGLQFYSAKFVKE